MAVETEERVNEVMELAVLRAKASKFCQRAESLYKSIEDFQKDFSSMLREFVRLENERSHLEAENKKADVRRATVEKEAQERLRGVESGHRSLIDRLSKRELELSQKLAEVEKRELIVSEGRRELELLKSEYQRKLDSMTEISEKAHG